MYTNGCCCCIWVYPFFGGSICLRSLFAYLSCECWKLNYVRISADRANALFTEISFFFIFICFAFVPLFIFSFWECMAVCVFASSSRIKIFFYVRVQRMCWTRYRHKETDMLVDRQSHGSVKVISSSWLLPTVAAAPQRTLIYQASHNKNRMVYIRLISMYKQQSSYNHTHSTLNGSINSRILCAYANNFKCFALKPNVWVYGECVCVFLLHFSRFSIYVVILHGT